MRCAYEQALKYTNTHVTQIQVGVCIGERDERVVRMRLTLLYFPPPKQRNEKTLGKLELFFRVRIEE